MASFSLELHELKFQLNLRWNIHQPRMKRSNLKIHAAIPLSLKKLKCCVCLSFGVSETLITFRDSTDKNKVI
jgi:hypothetical protein